MALAKALLILFLIAATVADYDNEVQSEAKKAVSAENEPKTRSANPGKEKGAFQKLSLMLNRTEDGKNRRRGKENLSKLFELNRKHKSENDRHDHNDMLNDNEGAIISEAENDTNSLNTKMKELRRDRPPAYEAVNKYTVMPKITGVFCNFENRSQVDMCLWEWNATVSSYGLGFKVATAADVGRMNDSTSGLRFSGPSSDADGNAEGHFLYLPVDPTTDNMVIKSPPFRGLWEFCKFEAQIHQSKMANASIRLVSESTSTEVQWILLEMTGNNFEVWHPMRFTIGKVLQEVRVMLEITRPAHISLNQPLPHIAVDNIRMLECLPEPPVFNGECQAGQIKCKIINQESCIKLQQVCDLVKDCDDGSDEHRNCDKMPYGAYCNFEQDNCGFENVPQPILKWSRHSGPTPTDKTGPNYDHTCGPPELYPTSVIVPPLYPAHLNYTLSCVGYYFFVNMNVTGPNKEKADFASAAIMQTVLFNPPPSVHGNISSPYYNCCMIRFYYQQNGRNYGSLSLDVVELTARGNTTTPLWFSTKDKGENWYRAAIFLPNITRRYFLQFRTRMGMRIYSDSAIDDFSMAPECFGLNIPKEDLKGYNYFEPLLHENTTPHPDFKDRTYYRFTTCGATGRFGPNQTMCDTAYFNTDVSVTVVSAPPFQGIQVWEVPEEGYYTIIAHGAAGGLGSAWTGVSHGATVRAMFHLHKGELIYMLPGQQGLNACKKTLSAQDSQECSRRPQNVTHQLYTSKTHEVRNTHVQDGGGGGGGGTYVFVRGKDGDIQPLLVAGGGGGVSVGVFRDDGSQHGKTFTNATPESGYMYGQPGKTSGAGGGWLARSGPSTPGFELVRGAALRAGGVGGAACTGGADGGFGGGGGGCIRGGGGGGWLGGNTNEGLHGGGGYSYIDSARSVRDMSSVTIANHMSSGEVVIIPVIHACDCDYRCVALNEYRSEVKCYCPTESWSLDSPEGTKCVFEDDWLRIPWYLTMVMSAGFIVVLIIIMCGCLYLYNSYQRKKEAAIRRKHLLEQEVQLHRLRNPPGGGEGALSAFNPHYGSESILPQGIDVRGLPQVARESLKLLKALGQGAFGEVYQGLYKHRHQDTVEMPVAVKTLPELSSSQAESDFLMEAAIMAKFNHPNIVHLIGVCFDRHPRFIVIELLAGGDLKNFLRESRPRIATATALTMKDLLLCALDICKGCRYLEAKRFIHRDIAARNCLLTSRGSGRVVKIADFGMARDIYRCDYYKKGGKAMLPIKWMPPEAYIDGVFSIKTDVWSFGVLLWEVFSLGVMPYTGCSNREVMEMVSGGGRLEKPYGCPDEIYQLMCECWNPIPEARPTFASMFDRLNTFLQVDPEILSNPLPVLRTALPPSDEFNQRPNGEQRAPPLDYLVPLGPNSEPQPDRLTDPLLDAHSSSPTVTREQQKDFQYPPLLKASQDYGRIPTGGWRDARGGDPGAGSSHEKTTKFLPSNSTDRLISSAEDPSIDDDDDDDCDEGGDISIAKPYKPKPTWKETSFSQVAVTVEPKPKEAALVVDKLISITPTSPKPPENALSKAIDADNPSTPKDKKLGVETKAAPIASPDPTRINAWANNPPPLTAKPKPLCLDAAQLEQNLNALKKNSGSVNLNTMNILPPYINVVTPNKLSESKTIKIDPKKAVIHDLQSPKEEEVVKEEGKLKTSSSAASLLNGPMTDVPYVDSDNASSGSSNPPNHITNIQKSIQNNYQEVSVGKKKVTKQGSNGGTEIANESEISC